VRLDVLQASESVNRICFALGKPHEYAASVQFRSMMSRSGIMAHSLFHLSGKRRLDTSDTKVGHGNCVHFFAGLSDRMA
jgi:hypothetical protein